MPPKRTFRRVFATVGTTKFDGLVSAVVSSPVLSALRDLGASELVVQHGSSLWSPPPEDAAGPRVSAYAYKSDIGADMVAADLVISHAGAGSITEALRAGKSLVVVVNDQLMDNHQAELAEALAERGMLVWTLPSRLERTLREADLGGLVPFGAADTAPFIALLDEVVFGE
ncbi:glycosyl transferase [Hyaloraphidium curvatum]|nr:glycosyl transferase [Hyaloraphidium curvatum]